MSDVQIFGVRHLSPAAGWHVNGFLNRIMPDVVLIEGPSDMTEQICHIVSNAAKPPIGVLAYTLSAPVESVLYPLAEYSPEYQAMRWAAARRVECRCIDLPSASILAFQISRRERLSAGESVAEAAPSDSTDIYEEIARRSGELSHEDWWERNFESIAEEESFRQAMLQYGGEIRKSEDRSAYDYAYNAVREAYMMRRIKEAVKEGYQTIAVICGAYHASALTAFETGAMTDDDVKDLPLAKSSLTLMPYAYSRLSSRSGYGAGNRAPAYYAMLFNEFRDGTTHLRAAHYLTALTSYLRKNGGVKSSAEVIDAVRLAGALAELKGHPVPVLRDLRDAASTVLGRGSFAPLAEAAATVEIGTDIGSLPAGIARTSVQEDFYRNLRELKLVRYQSQIAQEMELDLRENNRVKSEESAFLDLRRSRFLHRLALIGVSFAKQIERSGSVWAEYWWLQWTPEAEIEIVESSLLGDTIEVAAAYAVEEALEKCVSVSEAAHVVDSCVLAGLDNSLKVAAASLQSLSVSAASFTEIADTLFTLSKIRRYGDLRRTDTASLLPLISELFLRGAFLLIDASNCANDAAAAILSAVSQMETVAQNHYDEVDEARWIGELKKLAERDDLNPLLSGYAFAVLLDRGVLNDRELSVAVRYRLSNGTPADIGAAWFEGLSKKNRYALLARQSLWESLNTYIVELEPEEFKRAAVFLRRALSDYSPQEKVMIAENLARAWGISSIAATDAISRKLTDEETAEIADSLSDYDFGDL